jgi:hypothetical protein
VADCARPSCELPMGEHRIADWIDHNGAPSVDLPFEEVPGGPVRPFTAADGQVPVADHLTAGSIRTDLSGVPVAGVLFDLGLGQPGGRPERVWRGVYLGTGDSLRRAGRLLNDACAHAAQLAQPPRSDRRGR